MGFVDQALLSRFESWPIGGKAPQATHIMTLATIYQTAPLELLDTEALTRLGETGREVLIRCNPGYAIASHVPANEVLASPHMHRHDLWYGQQHPMIPCRR